MWVIDPIDGTINFSRQDDHWSVSIALVLDGKTIAGAVYLPGKKLMLYADSTTKKSSRVTRQIELRMAHLWTDWGQGFERQLRLLKIFREQTLIPQLRASCTASMAAVAVGNIDGYVHVCPLPYDFAAIALIVETHGGKVTELDGSPWHAFSPSIVATNGLLHNDILRIIR